MGIELPVSGVAAAFGEMHAYPRNSLLSKALHRVKIVDYACIL